MSRQFPATIRGFLNGFAQEFIRTPLGRFYEAAGVIDITTTPQNIWDVRFRCRVKGGSDRVGLVIPAGAVIYSLGIRTELPNTNGITPGQTISCASGNRLKLATAVGATGTQAFNASASTAYVTSTAFGANSIAAESRRLAIPPNGSSAVLTQDTTFRLFVDDGTTNLGSNVSVNKGVLSVVCYASWWQPAETPTLEDIQGRFLG